MNEKTAEAWSTIDRGLELLMSQNDELSDRELRAKTRRLKHLQKFLGALVQRVNERIREHTKPGAIDDLFKQYRTEREEIDAN